MEKHDYVEVTKGYLKGNRGYVQGFPTPKCAGVLTEGLLYIERPLTSLRVIPDEEIPFDETKPLPF